MESQVEESRSSEAVQPITVAFREPWRIPRETTALEGSLPL
jgi:hypothetical protein